MNRRQTKIGDILIFDTEQEALLNRYHVFT